MRISIAAQSPTRIKADCHVVAVWSEDIRRRAIASDDLMRFDREARGALGAAIADRRFKSDTSHPFEAHGPGGKVFIFLGAGKRSEMKAKSWLSLTARGARAAQRRRGKAVVFAPRTEIDETIARLIAEGAHLGSYRNYEHRGKGTKTDDKLTAVTSLTIAIPNGDTDALTPEIQCGEVVGQALTLARDLVNAPGNRMTASMLAERAVMWCEGGGISTRVFDKAQLEEMGCGGILAVNRGSTEPPRLIVMQHRPKGAPKGVSLALVGKGVTFDTGGISLKPGKGMGDMKCDMAGGAAVIAAMGAIGRLGLPINVTGLVPATDNMPDGSATKPGDVITHFNGKTTEVLNTDAEGRLILADALAYACKEFAPSHLVDFATLTGACVVALGDKIAGVMSPDDEFRKELCDLAEAAGEDVWPLPLNSDFTAQIKSSQVADLANISSSQWGGAETAGAFLKEFVDGPKWCHVDIAGPSFAAEAFGPYRDKGGTGYGVLMAMELAKSLAE